jgi:hypothetical protein
MGLLQRPQARSRAKLEARAAPAIATILNEGESVRAQGLGLMLPTPAFFLLGAAGAFFMRMYWVVVTDRRLALIRLATVGGDVQIERDVSLSDVDVARNRDGMLARYLTLVVDGKRYRLQFSTPYRSDGAAIADAVGNTGPPRRPDSSVR